MYKSCLNSKVQTIRLLPNDHKRYAQRQKELQVHGGVNKSPTVSEGGEAIEAPIVPGSEMLALMLTAFLTCL